MINNERIVTLYKNFFSRNYPSRLKSGKIILSRNEEMENEKRMD